MVASVTTLNTVFTSSDPFIVESDETKPAPKTNDTLLTPPAPAADASDIANVFSPPASISQLTPLVANVVLTEQAREKPLILQDPNPPLDNSPLGTLAALDDILARSLSSDKKPGPERPSFLEESGDPANFSEESGDSSREAAHAAAVEAYKAATFAAQQPQQSYITSAIDISA